MFQWLYLKISSWICRPLQRKTYFEFQRAGLKIAQANAKILELELRLSQLESALVGSAPRKPGQVDWIPSPSHFGNKIER